MEKKQKNQPAELTHWQISPETKKSITIIAIFVIAFLGILSLFNLAGNFGLYLNLLLAKAFGWGKIFFPFWLMILGWLLLNPKRYPLRGISVVGFFIFLLSYSGLFSLVSFWQNGALIWNNASGGGWLGFILTNPLLHLTGQWASAIILIGLFLISLMVTFNTSLFSLISRLHWWPSLQDWWNKKQVEKYSRKPLPGEVAEENLDAKPNKSKSAFAEITTDEAETPETDEAKKSKTTDHDSNDLKITKSKASRPVSVPLDLLDSKTYQPVSGNIKANMEKIKTTFANFGIEVEMGEVNVGPTVTQYTLHPAEGVKLSQIVGLQNDLALSLAAHPLRIEAPIPGKSLVGIEVPNQTVALVKLKEILASEQFQGRKGKLALALGKDVSGQAFVTELDKLPHLLIAGATGSGKSVCINDIIVSLLYQNNPEDLKLILVDPKRVELSTYNNVPHLLTPVITEVDKTVNALKWAVKEMDERYKFLQAVGKRNISAYNQSVLVNRLPYVVIIIDELADLMAVAAKEVEACIIRLAQMARAIGIHLIVATQRPSVNVITGLIKANITSRIAFAVASQIDSRTILDVAGAEKLLGKGDMLYSAAELSKPKRLQGAFISDQEIERVAEFWKNQQEPDYQDNVTERQTGVALASGESNGFDNDDGGDELLPEAKEIVVRAGKASASLLQRRLRIGYSRAARLLDILEEQGIIGPGDGAKPREVMINEGGNNNLNSIHEAPLKEYEESSDNNSDEIEPL
ncbi:MAG: DNA translocase FtsK 4TM domain-containing protein [Candidatus Komeilibacteria bacterium]|nr:DNA translocase FtsK 4TM domain-containing protein [Candidatus Komeilibacteria bacterium]